MNSNYKRQAILICVVAAIFYGYEYYLRVVPSVISQELIVSFKISHAGLGLLSAMFYYAYMPLQIPVGLLLDKYGPRIVLTFACLLCVIGNHLFAVTEHFSVAELGRFLLGFGSAFAFVGFLKICANWLPHKYYAFMVGVCMFLGTLGAMSGQIIIATGLNWLDWRSILILSGLVGALITVVLWIFVRNEPPDQTDNQSEPVLQGFLVSIKNSRIWLAGIIGCFTFMPLSSFAELWAIPYLEAIGYEKTHAATATSLIFLGFGIGGPLWGILSNLTKSRRIPLMIGSAAAALVSGFIISQPQISPTIMLLALCLLGFFTSAEILVFAVGKDIIAHNYIGTATAIINMIVMLGGMILQPIIGKILDIISSNSVEQYQTALLVLPIGLLAATILSFMLKESYKS